MHKREVDSLSIGHEWDLESHVALRERACCEGAGSTLRKRQVWVRSKKMSCRCRASTKCATGSESEGPGQ
jgi:hypothetical protein